MKKIAFILFLGFLSKMNAQGTIELTYGDTQYMTATTTTFAWGDYYLKDSLKDGFYVVYDNKFVEAAKLAKLGRDYYTDKQYRNLKHIRCKAHYVNGRKSGVVEHYSYPPSDDRTQKVESAFMTYSNGVLNGAFKILDGETLKKRGKYCQGIKDSVWETYSEGKLLNRSTYSMDTLLRIDSWYLLGQKDYSWSIETNEYKEWYPNGQIKFVVVFDKNGIVERHSYNEKGDEIMDASKVSVPNDIKQTYNKYGIKII